MMKQQILDALHAFVRQKPGLESANYNSRAAYQSDYRRVRQQLKDFERMLEAAERMPEIAVPELKNAFRSANRGRLELTESADGKPVLTYQAGQYYPTEYRAAACAVLAQALWDAARQRYAPLSHTSDWLRAHFRRRFGAALQRRWFD